MDLGTALSPGLMNDDVRITKNA